MLAGILEAQVAEVSNAYLPWFQMPEVDEINGWVRLTFSKIH